MHTGVEPPDPEALQAVEARPARYRDSEQRSPGGLRSAVRHGHHAAQTAATAARGPEPRRTPRGATPVVHRQGC
jgi:hypothetical protein